MEIYWLWYVLGAIAYGFGMMRMMKEGCLFHHNYSIVKLDKIICFNCGHMKEIDDTKSYMKNNDLKDDIIELKKELKAVEGYKTFFRAMTGEPMFRTFFNIVEKDDSCCGFKLKPKKE